MSALASSPAAEAVVALRESVQRREGLGITAAQDRCASLVHTSRRAWQQWERNERSMHPAFWELAQIKVDALVSTPAATSEGDSSSR